MSWENDAAWYDANEHRRAYCDQDHPGGDAEADRWCQMYHQPKVPKVVPDEKRCEFMVLPELRCPRKAQWDTRQIGSPLAGGRWCFHHSDLMRVLWEEVGVKARVSPISDT